MAAPVEYVNVLGVKVSAINMPRAIEVIDSWVQSREQHFVTITGVHGIMESQRDSTLRDIHNRAGLITPDGMPLVWISHRRGWKNVSRVYGPDLLLEVCNVSTDRGYRHYFYGGAPGVADQLATRLQTRFPGLQVAGTYCPPFRPLTPEEDAEMIEEINAANPDIVWVGLSTPKQERWMNAQVGRLNAPVMVGVGAAFDFHAGLKAQAPRWMQRNGLEWLFRLSTEPRRLWKRYLVNNPSFVALILMQELGLRQYQVSSVETRTVQA